MRGITCFAAVELSSLMSLAVHWWSPFDLQKVFKWEWEERSEWEIFHAAFSISESRQVLLEGERPVTLQAKCKMQLRHICGWLHICLLQSNWQHSWEQNPCSCCSCSFNHRSWDLVNTSLQKAPVWMTEAHQLWSGWILNILFPEKTSATSGLSLLPNLAYGLPLHEHYEQMWGQPKYTAGLTWGLIMLGAMLGSVLEDFRELWRIAVQRIDVWHCPQKQWWDVSKRYTVWTPTISDQQRSEKETNL